MRKYADNIFEEGDSGETWSSDARGMIRPFDRSAQRVLFQEFSIQKRQYAVKECFVFGKIVC